MPNNPISEKEQLAWDYAKEKHKGQVRKFINQPYFDAHVKKVNDIVKKYIRNEDILCASILHDVLEDCFDDKEVGYYEIKELFGKKVADLVLELTSDKEEIIETYYGSKKNYLIDKMINMSSDALTIKLSDRLQNISDAFTASEKFRIKYSKDTAEIIEQIIQHRRLTRVQSTLINEIQSKLKNVSLFFKIKRVDDT